MLYFKGWDILSHSHFPNSCMKTRCLESRPGNSHLELHGYWLFLKGKNPRDGNQQDRRSLGFWLLLPVWEPGLKEKKSSIFFKSLLAWVSVTNSFIYVLINSKGNKNQWMKMIHAQMENPQYKPYFTFQSHFFFKIQKGCQNFWKWSIMLASSVEHTHNTLMCWLTYTTCNQETWVLTWLFLLTI